MSSLLASLLLLAPFPGGQEAPAWPHPHLGRLDAAFTEARDRNAVIALFILQENEEANDRFRDGVFHHPDVARRCEDLVVLLVNNGLHPPRKVREKKNGEVVEREICSRYGTPTCEDHRRYFDRVFQEFNEGEVMRTPQLVLFLPDGKLRERLVDEHEVETVLRRIDAVAKEAGPSIRAAVLAEVRKEASTARAAQGRGKWPRAWRAWTRVLSLASRGRYATEAGEGVECALQGMRDELATTVALLEQGRVTRGYARLLALREGYRGTPVEREAIAAVRAAEKNKEWKEEIEAYRREVAAEELWQKVMAAVGEGKTRTAERLAGRILKKYGDTRAAARVREEFPHLLQDGGDDGTPPPRSRVRRASPARPRRRLRS